MPQHRPMQWQLGGRLGPGAPVPESWSVSPLIVFAERPRGIGITAGGPSAPICVRPEFAIGIGRMRLPRRRHRTKPPRARHAAQVFAPRAACGGWGGWYMTPRYLRRHPAPPGRAVPVLYLPKQKSMRLGPIWTPIDKSMRHRKYDFFESGVPCDGWPMGN